MRDRLKDINLQRKRFKGTFKYYGKKKAYKGYPGITILLTDITTTKEEPLTDHLWFNHTKGFEALGVLHPGDVIAFNARVRTYIKGYVGRDEEGQEVDNRTVDYHMSHPSKVSLFSQVERDESYYTTCIRCGFHNPSWRLQEDKRCYRCGNDLTGEVPDVDPPESISGTYNWVQMKFEGELKI